MFPAVPKGVDTGTYAEQHLTDCASGKFDTYFTQIGNWLNTKGRSDAFVRIGWEPNGTWFAWQAVDHRAWVSCFRNEAKALLGADPQARIEWDLNAHSMNPDTSDPNPFDLYPGDDVVDVIGIDTYDQYPPSQDPATFDRQCEQAAPTPGMCTVIEFAQGHHKLFAVPEWGLVGKESKAGESGGGDNTVYIDQMYQKFKRYAYMLAYEAYFNNADADNVNGALYNPVRQPQGSAEYAKLWG
jgi:hypothetical protein